MLARTTALTRAALPYGKYHPKSGQDGADNVVNIAAKDAALAD